MLSANFRTTYVKTDTDIQDKQWTLSRPNNSSKLTIVLDRVKPECYDGRIKGYWLVEMESRVILFHPNFEAMAGLNYHPVLKNPELIMLSNLDIASLSIKEATEGRFEDCVLRLTYGNFVCDSKDRIIDTECSYLSLDFTGLNPDEVQENLLIEVLPQWVAVHIPNGWICSVK